MTARMQAVAVGAITLVVWALARWVVFPFAQVGDTRVSQHVARMIDAGLVPYRDFDVEYPPLATGLFWLIHRIPGPPTLVYSLVMGSLLAVATGATWLISAHLRLPRRQALLATAVMACSPILVGTLLQTRYDLVLTALFACALLAALRRSFGWMWTLLAIAAAIKVVPIVVFPVAAIWHARRAERARAVSGLTTAVAAVAATVVPFVLIAPKGMWALGRYHLARPLQIESFGASIIRIAHLPFRPVFSFGSDNMEGAVPTLVALISSIAAIVAVVMIVLLLTRSSGSDRALLAAFAATLLVAVVFSKVLSAQYVVWLIPAALLIPGRLGTLTATLTALAMPLTQWVYPALYPDLIERSTPLAGMVLVARNGLLLLAAASAIAAITARPTAPAE